jgi:hypothetical protein
VGAAVGALGGLLFGSLLWVIGLTILGAVLGVGIDLLDKIFYKPESRGGGQNTATMLAFVILVIALLITILLTWLATI